MGQLAIEVEPHPPPGYTVMVLIDPRGKKGPNTNCLKRLVCVEQQELCQDWNRHDPKLDLSRMWAPIIVSEKLISHFTFM